MCSGIYLVAVGNDNVLHLYKLHYHVREEEKGFILDDGSNSGGFKLVKAARLMGHTGNTATPLLLLPCLSVSASLPHSRLILMRIL